MTPCLTRGPGAPPGRARLTAAFPCMVRAFPAGAQGQTSQLAACSTACQPLPGQCLRRLPGPAPPQRSSFRTDMPATGRRGWRPGGHCGRAQQHLRVCAAGELGADPLPGPGQHKRLGVERSTDPVGRGVQQQRLPGLAGGQPAQPAVLPAAQHRDDALGIRAVRLPVRRLPPPGRHRRSRGWGRPARPALHRVCARRHAIEPASAWRQGPARARRPATSRRLGCPAAWIRSASGRC